MKIRENMGTEAQRWWEIGNSGAEMVGDQMSYVIFWQNTTGQV